MKKYKALCEIELTTPASNRDIINRGDKAELISALDNTVRLKINNDSVLKNVPTSTFSVCFK